MRFDFMIVDVFTDVAFGGNQLAVLTDARGLTSEAMQTITREFDFAETTFVLPPDDPRHARRVRIFTPGRELPFAGHPTVGTACALVMSGACPAGAMVLEEGVGPVPVEVEQRRRALFRRGSGWSARPEVPDSVPSHADMAAVLSVEPDDGESTCSARGSGSISPTSSCATARRSTARSSIPRRGGACSPTTGARRSIRSPASWPTAARSMRACSGRRSGSPKTRRRAPRRRRSSARRRSASGSLSLDIRQGVKMGRPSLIRTSATVEGGRAHVDPRRRRLRVRRARADRGARPFHRARRLLALRRLRRSTRSTMPPAYD